MRLSDFGSLYVSLSSVIAQPNPKHIFRPFPVPTVAPDTPSPLELVVCPEGSHPISFDACATLPNRTEAIGVSELIRR